MKVSIAPGSLSGTLTPPASKSLFQRACAAALLTPVPTTIFNRGFSNDDRVALALAQQLGLQILSEGGKDLKVQGVSQIAPACRQLYCGESGLSTRLFTPVAAGCDLPFTVAGEGSLLRRPLPDLVEALQAGSATVTGGPTLPLTVQGPLQIAHLVLEGSASSQTATGILFAMATNPKRPLTLQLRNPVSLPYLALTVEVLRAFGWPVAWDGGGLFHFSERRREHLKPLTFGVESDWSSAAAGIVAGTLAGGISVSGLHKNSLQADKIVLETLFSAGGKFEWEGNILQVAQRPLKAFTFNATHAPDLVPLLAIAAAVAKGETEIKGMARLQHKESNRAQTTAYLLTGFGVSHHFVQDSLFITGRKTLQGGGTFHSHGDHRIAMAAAVGALLANAPVVIEGAEAVQKSYGAFFSDLALLGASVSTIL